MFNKHPQGGNVGKPQDPHRLPLPDAHLTFPRFVSPTEVNHDIFGFLQIFLQHVTTSSNKSCESLSKKWMVTGIGQSSTINKLKILLEEKCYGKSHNLRLCVLESLKWTTCRWRIPVFGTVARVPVSYFSRNSMEFSQTRLLDTLLHQKLGSSDFYNDLPNLKGKSNKIGQVISATFHPIP